MAADPVDRSRLPIADPEFAGVTNRTLEGSRPDWGLIGHVAPPEGAPNVPLVLIDDAGFGQPSAFGGPIEAPVMTRVGDEGARFNRFHVTALCSPTRAALLTGRNHHAVGFGSIGELSSGFPGYTAFVPEDSAPFPKVLQGNGVVDRGYVDKAPFAFTGTVKKVVFDIKPHLSADDGQALHESAHHGHVAHGISG